MLSNQLTRIKYKPPLGESNESGLDLYSGGIGPLFHFNEDDESSFPLDSNNYASDIQTYKAVITRSNGRFYNSSLYLPTGGYVDFKVPEFQLTNQFQFESWNYITSYDYVCPFVAYNNTNPNDTLYFHRYEGNFIYGDHYAYIKITPTIPFNLHEWFHLAISFDGTHHRIFINGAMVAKWTRVAPYTFTNVLLGRRNKGTYSTSSNHWMDEVKLRLGSAVYTSDSEFTPQTRQFST